MKEKINKYIANFLYYSGLTGLLNIIIRRFKKSSLNKFSFIKKWAIGNYQVLIYHRINPEQDPFSIGALKPDIFKKQIEFLKKFHSILPLRDILLRAESGELPPNTIAITFDDGYADNYTYAFPILKEYEVPATLFLTVGAVGNETPLWFDKIFYAFKVTKVDVVDLRDWGLDTYNLHDNKNRIQVLPKIISRLRYYYEKERNEAITILLEKLKVSGFTEIRNLMIDWDMAREMDNNGFTIEAHTVSHPILSRLSEDRIDEEIRVCKNILEDKLQKQIKIFAYPNGSPDDFNEIVINYLKKYEFNYAFTTINGKNFMGDNPYMLKRGGAWQSEIPSYSLYQTKINIFNN